MKSRTIQMQSKMLKKQKQQQKMPDSHRRVSNLAQNIIKQKISVRNSIIQLKQVGQFNPKKQVLDIIQYEQNYPLPKASLYQNDQARQKTYLHQLYNQDIAPQDSQKTLFYYLKTLAYQMVMAMFTFMCIFLSILMFYNYIPTLSDTQAKIGIMMFTLFTMVAATMETHTRVKWLYQKKQKESSAFDYYLSLFLQLILLLPCPNLFISGYVQVSDINGNSLIYSWDEILTVFMLGRVIYAYRFMIHSQLYYGSRPDRLSRLYTVKFGTFNAFKFLINERPLLIVGLMSTINLIFLPTLLLLIQGNVNEQLGSFMSCVHFAVVTQVTVGYGNIVPITIYGRIVSFACVLVGVTSTSLLLIFFMRMMEQSSQQEQAHLLLSSLQKRQQIAKARVLRIETQYLYSKVYCRPQQRDVYQQKLRQFRFQNRRAILFQRQQPANVKRLMLSNFSAVIQMINQLKEKQSILGKIIQFIIKTNNSPNLFKNSSLMTEEDYDEDKLVESNVGQRSRKNQINRKNRNNQYIMAKVTNKQLKKTIMNSN